VLEFSQLQDLIWPGWQGHPARDSWTGTGSWADGQLHPGLGTLAIALLALGGPRRHLGRAIWIGWCVLVAASLVGLPGPFNHARLGSLGALLLAICAGIGASRLQGLGRSALAGLVVVVLFSGAWARESDQGILSADAHDPSPAEWTQELAREVGCADDDCARVLGLGWWLQPNTGSLAGLRDLRGYDLPVSEDTHRLMAALSSPPRSPWYPVDELPSLHLLRFAGVRAVLAPDQPGALEPLALGPSPVNAWRVPGEVLRAWVSPSAVKADSPEAALRAISEQDLRARPPVEGLHSPLEGTGEILPVELHETGNSTRHLEVETESPGLLVVSEAWAPGWSARIDGEEVSVLRVGGAFMGVRLVPGRHEVFLSYEPDGWLYGRWFGLLGLVVLGSAISILRHRDRRDQRTDR